MYATVFKKDPLDPALGQRYREKILRVGGSREETESLEVRFQYTNKMD
jgi:metallopeptidase MepB